MRNVVVTGASRGLGLSMARVLAAAGYSVIGVARRESAEFTQLMSNAGAGRVLFRALDLLDCTAIPSFINGLRREFGSFYGLVNNAGIGTGGLLANMRDAQIEQMVRLNTIAPVLLTKYVVRSMLAHGGGRIVNVSSIVTFTGYTGLAVYSATKASLVGFTRSLARELGKVGITVNAVAPGFVDTHMTEGLDEQARSRIIRRSALGRLVSAEDIAHAVEFLLSEKAGNITGTVLTVDAGASA